MSATQKFFLLAKVTTPRVRVSKIASQLDRIREKYSYAAEKNVTNPPNHRTSSCSFSVSLNLLQNGEEMDNVTELFRREIQCSLMHACNLGI
jgi:hypothetical protein